MLPEFSSLFRYGLAALLALSVIAAPQRFCLAQTAAPASPAPVSNPSDGPAIVGRVETERGPLGGATVTIAGPATRSFTTLADGAFAFVGIPAGTYRVTARAPGYQSSPALAVTTGSTTPQTLTISLATASLSSLRTIGSVTAVGRGSTAINTSGAAESTLTSQDFIDRGEAQVTDMLEELPGVELDRNDSSAPGSNAEVAVRGASPYETQVLIDGHPVNGGQYGDFLVQFLNPLVLGTVEVDKGPGVFGNTIQDAVGGTVNFRTPNISSTYEGRLTTGYDSYNGSTYSARVSDTFGKLGVLAAYGFDGTPGYFDGSILSVNSGSAQLGVVPAGTVNQSVPASETFQNRSEVFKLAYGFSPATQLTLGSIDEQTYVDYTASLDTVEPVSIVACTPVQTGPMPPPCTSYTNPSYGNLIGKTVLASTTDDNLYAGNFEFDNEPIFTADLRTTFGPGSFLARYYTGDTARNIDDPGQANQITNCPNAACTSPATEGSGYYETEVDRLRGADFEYSLPFARDGQDLAQVSYDQHSDRSTDCSGPSADFTTAAACGGIFDLTQTSKTFSIRAYANVLPKVRVGFANYFSDTTFVGSRYDPRASIVWTPTDNTAVRFAVGTSYVAPPAGLVAPIQGANKVVADDTLEVSDALEPETSAGINIGADFRLHRDSKFTIDAYETALTHRFSTLTVRPSNGENPFGYYDGKPFKEISEIYNASDANEEGIEFGYLRAPAVGIGVVANFDLLRAYNYNLVVPQLPGYTTSASQTSTVNGDGSETPGFQIPGFPYSHGRLQLSYRFPSTARFAFGQSIYGANNSFGEPGFSLFDFNANLPVDYGLRLVGSVNNIFNHDDYRTLAEYAYGYIPPGEGPVNLLFAPPRTVTLQLIYPFGGH
jgi:outer membrane receptor for ferrienterochelin and colicin